MTQAPTLPPPGDDTRLGVLLAEAPETEAALVARLHTDVARRLRGVCAAMTPDLFGRVVDAVVARRLRWARRAAADRPFG